MKGLTRCINLGYLTIYW